MQSRLNAERGKAGPSTPLRSARDDKSWLDSQPLPGMTSLLWAEAVGRDDSAKGGPRKAKSEPQIPRLRFAAFGMTRSKRCARPSANGSFPGGRDRDLFHDLDAKAFE